MVVRTDRPPVFNNKGLVGNHRRCVATHTRGRNYGCPRSMFTQWHGSNVRPHALLADGRAKARRACATDRIRGHPVQKTAMSVRASRRDEIDGDCRALEADTAVWWPNHTLPSGVQLWAPLGPPQCANPMSTRGSTIWLQKIVIRCNQTHWCCHT